MRRICWHALALLLLLSLAGCEMTGGSQGQRATSSPSPFAQKVDGGVIEPAQPTADPTATATATATPTVAATPTAHPTARPTSPVQSGGASLTMTELEKQLQQQLFALINQERADQGLFAYTLNNTMSNGALLHSTRMASCGLSHQCPGENSPCQRVSNEGISWTSCGENVGYSSPNPNAWGGVKNIEVSMLNEQPPDDGHRRNLLSTSFHRVGVGIYIDSSGLVWLTEDFVS